MKLNYSIYVFFLFTALIYAQEKTAKISMGSNYSEDVYFKLNTQKKVSYPSNSWDLAFFKDSPFETGIRINNRIELYEVSDDPVFWNTVNVNDKKDWIQLYNSSKNLRHDAFSDASGDFGWGTYNMMDHHIKGSIIFVLKYPDNTYKKLFIEDYFGGYTFRYATWDGAKWSEDVTAKVMNSSSVNNSNSYNYYSLKDNKEVVAEPKKDEWDLLFTKYNEDLVYKDATIKYLVTGVLKSNNVKVAKTITNSRLEDLEFMTDMNAIGYNWKKFDGSAAYKVNSDIKYFIKYQDGTIYKLYFTNFAGSSTGDVEFKFEDVTTVLSTEEFSSDISIGCYPNPVKANKKLNVLIDVSAFNAKTNVLELYNTLGQRVYHNKTPNKKGFYNAQIDLKGLNTGVYLLKFTSGKQQKIKRIILN